MTLKDVGIAKLEEAFHNAITEYRVLPDGQLKKAELFSPQEREALEQVKAKLEQEKAGMAQAGAGILAPITEIEIFGMPLGEAAVGGGLALFATEIIDAFITAPADGVPMTRVLVKGVLGFAMVQFLSGPLGSGAAKAAALFLGFSLLRDLLPIDTWIKGLVKGMKGNTTSNNPGGGNYTESNPSGSNGHDSSVDPMAMLRATAGR